MSERPTWVGALTTTLASVQSLIWDPPMRGAKPGLKQALWGAHLLVWGKYLHCCMPHTSLRLPFWRDSGGGMLLTGNGEEGEQRLVLSVFPLRSGAAERAPHSLLSLCVSPSFSSPSPFPSSSLSSLLPFDVRRAVCHSRVCTEKGSEVSASARRLSFDPCPEACLTAKKSMETKRLSQSDS